MTLKELREIRGYAQREVADRLGIKTPNTISNWERGATQPVLPMRRLLAELYGVSIVEINQAIDETAASRTGTTTQIDAIQDQ